MQKQYCKMYECNGSAILHSLAATDVTRTSSRKSVLMYVTTHLSSMHIRYLEQCWPHLLLKSPLYRSSDFIIFITQSADQILNTTIIEQVFANTTFTIHSEPNPGYHEGAVLAMTEAFDQQWFDSYDWVIRLNPDVLIRNDTFLLQTFEDDGIDGIFADCWDVPCPEGKGCTGRKTHTDFFAFRPSALPRNAFADSPLESDAEWAATRAFSSIIMNKRDCWVPGAGPHSIVCRIRGDASPVIHTHDFNEIYPACLSWYK